MPSNDQPQCESIWASNVAPEESGKPPESRGVLVSRGIIFMLVLLYITIGPFYKQVLHGKSDVFRSWQMFHNRGLDVCDVEFYLHHPDGRTEKMDYFKILGYDDFLKAPHDLRRVRGENGVLYVGQLIRQNVGNEVDLRVNARIATREGWKPLYSDKRVE